MFPYSLRTVSEDSSAFSEYGALLRRLLMVRGITSAHDAELFLNPDWVRDTHDPFLMKDMQRAVERIVRAYEKHEHIAIWSDYDMDGIPGAALLFDALCALGYERVTHHTPHRNRDGFGLNKTGIKELADSGVTLIITVDCGIGDGVFVEYAATLALDVIVTDHHIPHGTPPPAYAIVNPKQSTCEYPEKMLCGAGVAFKLAHALIMYTHTLGSAWTGRTPPQGWERWLLDMAGMSTVADLVPLRGENRTMAYFGLTVLRKSRRPGLQALLKKARVTQRHLTEDDISFTIAPRVNAASRMGHARDAFALLTTRHEVEAGALAHSLDKINTERKTAVAVMKREIARRLEKLGEPKSVIVLGNPDWKPSLLGLVAGGLAEEYQRPVFLWGREEGVTIKGSCRSDGITNVFELMHETRDLFIEYGGHMQSGGFSIADEQVHVLEQALIEAHRISATHKETRERIVDAELSLMDVTWDTYRAIERLAPFGEGNPKPIFGIRDVIVDRVRTFGKGGEHVELMVRSDTGDTVKAIAFFTSLDEFHRKNIIDDHVSLMVHLEASSFSGSRELRLRLLDVI